MLKRSLFAMCLAPTMVTAEVPDCGLYTYAAELVRVVDGDTIVVNVDLGFEIWLHNERIRLFGVDTPERGEDGFDEATIALAGKLDGKQIYLCTVKAKRSDQEQTGSFGRYLATVFVDGEDVNAWLLGEGLAVLYEE